MPLQLVDTHCHLDLAPLAASVDAVLERARAVGVRWCISIGTTLSASRANVELAQRHVAMVRAAVGIHPHEADSATDEAIAEIDALAGRPGVVAIGEVGLDQYRRHAAPEAQARALRGFIAVARRRGLPILIHCREAYEPLLAILRVSGGPCRGIIHCASGPPEFIRESLALGLHISFAGNVTFPNAGALRQLVELVPDDRLLVETDAPFLAPQPVRGQTNEPGHVAHTAAFLAKLRGTSLDALAALTTRNACRLFGLPMGSGPNRESSGNSALGSAPTR